MLQSCASRFKNLRWCVSDPLGRKFCDAMRLSVILTFALLVQAVESRISPLHPVVSAWLGCHLHLIHCKQSHSWILKFDNGIVTLDTAPNRLNQQKKINVLSLKDTHTLACCTAQCTNCTSGFDQQQQNRMGRERVLPQAQKPTNTAAAHFPYLSIAQLLTLLAALSIAIHD